MPLYKITSYIVAVSESTLNTQAGSTAEISGTIEDKIEVPEPGNTEESEEENENDSEFEEECVPGPRRPGRPGRPPKRIPPNAAGFANFKVVNKSHFALGQKFCVRSKDAAKQPACRLAQKLRWAHGKIKSYPYHKNPT